MTALHAALHAWRHEHNPGTVGYAGYVADRDLLWARQMPVSDLSTADWDPAAAILTALACPSRLALLKTLLHGPAPLDATDDVEALQAAHLITRNHRGDHQLSPQAVVPVLTILAAATNLAADGSGTAST